MTVIQQLEAEKREIQQRVEKRAVDAPKARALEWEIIVLLCAEEFGVDARLVYGKGRPTPVADARQVAMVMIYRFYHRCRRADIAAFVNRDHGTLTHAIEAVQNKSFDARFKAKVERIEQILTTRFEKRKGEVVE